MDFASYRAVTGWRRMNADELFCEIRFNCLADAVKSYIRRVADYFRSAGAGFDGNNIILF